MTAATKKTSKIWMKLTNFGWNVVGIVDNPVAFHRNW